MCHVFYLSTLQVTEADACLDMVCSPIPWIWFAHAH